LKFFWLKVTCGICQSNELERAKNLGGTIVHPGSLLEPPPLSLLCDVRYSTMEKLSWLFLIYCYIT